ncbi:MAG: accessory gene regulator B family protein [Clostridia bacterium]
MRKLAEFLVRILERKTKIPAADREVYVYGLDTTLYTFFSTAGLILIGYLLSRGVETLIIIAFFYTNQRLGGGFHASTHLTCFLTMALGLLGCIASFALPFHLFVCCAFGAVSLVLMIKYPLVLHENKQHLQCKESEFRRHSRLALLGQALCLLCIALWGKPEYIQAISAALTVCTLSRMVAIFSFSPPAARLK